MQLTAANEMASRHALHADVHDVPSVTMSQDETLVGSECTATVSVAAEVSNVMLYKHSQGRLPCRGQLAQRRRAEA